MSSRRKQKDARREDRALDTEGRMRRATLVLVGWGLNLGDDDAKVRGDVTRAIKTALEGDEPEPLVMTIDGRETPMVDAAGVFRVVIDHERIDRRDLRAQERWFAVVRDEVERALSKARAIGWRSGADILQLA